ncbi:hypothetical protein [Streptomyces sp. NPDC094468]|uniref:hypothetical protein n=1 Tax=Streptomyces sp. NPDC094468 TaxID=3366066 RepID=UPI00380F2BD6
MAFECGALGSSGGQSSLEALEELLAHLVAEDQSIEHDPIKQGESWAATTLNISRPNEAAIRQYVQVSVGGEVLALYLEDARETLSEDQLLGKDLMLTTTLRDATDPIVNDRIMSYALNEWHGIPWDETSGFIIA